MDYLRRLILAVADCVAAFALGASLFLFFSSSAHAAKLPGDAEQLLPILKTEVSEYWPGLAPREYPAGLIEQESGWKVRATLRTGREFGCGLGQFTQAYRADGSIRFDAMAEIMAANPKALAGWRDCYDAKMQIRAVVLKLRSNDRQFAGLMADNRNTKAAAAAAYNGGGGSVLKRIRSCQSSPGCNPRVWFGNLEHHAPQSKTKAAGYGQSFADINSAYPAKVEKRMSKYREPMQ